MLFIIYTYMTTAPSPPVITAISAIDSASIRIEWSLPANPNGMLTVYTITYNVDGGVMRTVYVPYNGQPVSR